MTRMLFGFRHSCPIAEELRDVRLPASEVEIGDTVLVLVGNADPFQVFFDHEPSPGNFRALELASFDPLPWMRPCTLFDSFLVLGSRIFGSL
jgi:hypothetical protein